MTSREKFEAWWEQEKYDDKLNYITGIMFNRIKVNMFLSWEAASREQEKKLTDMAVQLANAESKCRGLAGENAHARERHVFIRALAVSILEHSGGRMDWRGAMEDATELLQTVDSVYAITPATDAFLAEVRAQGVEMLLSSLPPYYTARADIERLAAKLRKGDKS